MERLAREYAGLPVQFVLIYTREPHANEGVYKQVDQPTDYCQRQEYAHRTREELGIQREILVDDMEGTVQKAYGGCPNMVYVVDPRGTVSFHDRWADAKAVAAALQDIFSAPSS